MREKKDEKIERDKARERARAREKEPAKGREHEGGREGINGGNEERREYTSITNDQGEDMRREIAVLEDLSEGR